MIVLSDDQARLLELFERLPADLQEQAIEVLGRLNDRDTHAGPFGWLLGYHYVEAGPGHARCTLEIADIHLNPSGVAHGGVLCTLADAALGAAAHHTVEAGQRCVTAELKVNFLKAIRPGRVTATATVVHKGSRLVVVTGEVHDDAGALVGVALGTFAVIAREKKEAAG
ncbi:MAG TPA: PaaI family thioesterase [Herpetosiphonaceae bacterium]|nr:PaaI family thioesterase [Herpetosiphonaceae bacterium]